MAPRDDSDEQYVLDLCDEAIGSAGERQARFDWLRRDPSASRREGKRLPVDAYWPDLRLVVEFQEEQSEPTSFFDRRETDSEAGRGEQRRLDDERKAELIPQHDLRLVVMDKHSFTVKAKRMLRDHDDDLETVRELLEPVLEADAITPVVRSRHAEAAAAADELTDEERAEAEKQRDRVTDFVKGLSIEQFKNGDWFADLLTFSLDAYKKEVAGDYFAEKYKGAPPDVIVDQRIKLASRYAALEGGFTATAYTTAIAATIGSLGGASPLTVPAAAATIAMDLVALSQLQVRLAWDTAVLYGVPIDTDDSEDLWRLIKVAFTVKSGELAREGALKVVPAAMRPLIKKFFSGATLKAAQSLPVVGRFLLQRNVIKIGIPLVGIPLATGMNYWTTTVAGQHARNVFRNEARVIEAAEQIIADKEHAPVLLWVAWLITQSDGKISDDEALLMRHLIRLARERHEIEDAELAHVIDTDREAVFARIAAETRDSAAVLRAAESMAAIDGDVTGKEKKLLDELAQRLAAR